jgi:hypothetical protein
MKIKLFESFNIHNNMKNDILSIFVELIDIGYNVDVDIEKHSSGDQISIIIDNDLFTDLSQFIDYFKMFEEYIFNYLKNYEISYKLGLKYVSNTDNLYYKYMGETYEELLKREMPTKFIKEIIIIVIED